MRAQTRTIPTRRGPIHGVTHQCMLGGFHAIRTRTGRRVAVLPKTMKLMRERGLA